MFLCERSQDHGADADPLVETIVRGIDTQAQRALVSILGEAMCVWANLHVAGDCNAQCKRVARLTRLEQLYRTLLRTSPATRQPTDA